jgi:hypothetical protein
MTKNASTATNTTPAEMAAIMLRLAVSIEPPEDFTALFVVDLELVAPVSARLMTTGIRCLQTAAKRIEF